MSGKPGKMHILIGAASVLFLTGSVAQYLAGYLTAALLGLVLGISLGVAAYRVYIMQRAAAGKDSQDSEDEKEK